MPNTKVACRGTTDTFVSDGVDLSTSAGLLCYVNTNGKVKKATAATDGPLYVIVEFNADTDAAGTICLHGKCDVKAGATIAEGDALTAETNSKVIATTTADDYIIGFAKHGAAANDEVEVDVRPNLYSVD